MNEFKEFDEWNKLKKQLSKNNKRRSFKEREIFWAYVGYNIGSEVYGRVNFTRPILILKKFNRDSFMAIPLSIKKRKDEYGKDIYRFEFIFKDNKSSIALLSQAKFFDKRRLLNKMGMIKNDDFETIKEKLNNILGLPSIYSPTKS